MFTFTLAAPTPVRISAVGSKFDTTLSLWNYQPGNLARPSSGTPMPFPGGTYSTRHDARTTTRARWPSGASHLGDIDGTWKVRASANTGPTVEGSARRRTIASRQHRRDPGSLGALSGYTRTSGATTGGLSSDYSEYTLQCGFSVSNTAPDAIFKFTGTPGHTLRVGAHNPAATPGTFNTHVAVFEADPGERC